MAQAFLRPDADDVDGNWRTQSGSDTLYAVLDETSADDIDYIQSPVAPAAEVCRVALGNPIGPVSQPFTVSYRFNLNGGRLTVRLIQGASTVIATWEETGVSGWTTSDRTLSGAQFVTISDFTNLFVEFTANTVGVGLLPVLDLNFAAMGATGLDSRVTFSRATGGWSYNSDGLLVQSPINQILQSNNFDAWIKENTTVTTGVTDPDGGTTASTITVTGGSSHLDRRLYIGGNFAGVWPHGNLSSVWIRRRTGTGTIYLTGASGQSYVPVIVTSAWARVSTPENPGTWFIFAFANNGDAVDVWHAQMDFRSPPGMTVPRPYVETTGAATAFGPRFDYDPVTFAPRGLLIEDQSTNLILQSVNLADPGAWIIYSNGSGTVARTADAGLAPDGTMTATLFVLDRTDASNTWAQAFQQTWTTAASPISCSIWLKAKDAASVGKQITLHNYYQNVSPFATPPLNITLTAEWVRYSLTAANPGSYSAAVLGYHPTVYSPGVSAQLGLVEFYAWGMQVEPTGCATSYIPTPSATVTRAADSAVMTGTNFSSWWSASAGTFVVEFIPFLVTGPDSVLSADNGTSAEWIALYVETGSPFAAVIDGGGVQAILDAGAITANSPSKFAVAFAANDFATSFNGGTVVVDAAGTLPTVDRLRIGTDMSGQVLSGHYGAVRFYNVRKSDAELQDLTGPALDLDFTKMGTLDSRLTFARGSTATYTDRMGVIRTGGIDGPRFDYDPVTHAPRGLLIEQQRTNGVPSAPSSVNNNSIWLGFATTVAGSATTAPDGTLEGSKATTSGAGSYKYIYNSTSIFATGTFEYVVSAYLKRSDWNYLYINFSHEPANNWVAAVFDLSTGAAVTETAGGASSGTGITAGVIDVGNGWYRCWVAGTTTGTFAKYVQIGFAGTATGNSFDTYGNINTVATGMGERSFFVWGPQLELGAFPTSPIVSTVSGTTRASDGVAFNDIGWFTQAQGTVVQEVSQLEVTSTNAVWFFAFGSGPNSALHFFVSNFPNWVIAGFAGAIAGDGFFKIGEYTANVPFKSAMAWTANDYAGVKDGGTVVDEGAGFVPPTNITQIWLGYNWYGYSMHGHFRRLRFYKTRKTNAELRELTLTDPTLDLDFTKMGTLDRKVTFTRASAATRVDRRGLVALAPHNLMAWSQSFTDATKRYYNMTATDNVAVAPDGSTTASRLQGTGTSGAYWDNYPNDYGFNEGKRQVWSLYAKAGTTPVISISSWTGTASFNLSTGTLTSENPAGCGSIQAVGNGWYRIAVSYTKENSFSYPSVAFGTGSAADNVYVWGTQLEQSTDTVPGTYISTTTAASYGGPRFDYDPVTLQPRGLLIEEQRTNVMLNSSRCDLWNVRSLTINPTAALAPDGTMTANQLTDNTGSGDVYQGLNQPTGTTFSVYAKAGTSNTLTLSDSERFATFDLGSGTSVTTGIGNVTAAITPVGGGWYRCEARFSVSVVFYLLIPGSGAGSTIFVWGAQVETGSFATSYIPTTTAAVTRSADDAMMTGTNFSSWFNASEGTIVLKASALGMTYGVASYISVQDAGYNDAYEIASVPTAVRLLAWVGPGWVAEFPISHTFVPNEVIKAALAFKTNDYAACLNGGTPVTDNVGAVSTIVDQLHFVQDYLPIASVHFERLQFYSDRKPDAQLQALTAPDDAPPPPPTPFTPADLASLTAQFDGNDFTAQANGTAIATWSDKKGTNHATQPLVGNRPTVDATGLNSKAVVNFNNAAPTQGFSLPNFVSGYTAGSVFVVNKLDADPPGDNKDAPPVADFGTGSLSDHHPWTDGAIYSGWGTIERKSSVNPATSLATWHILNFNSAAGAWSLYLNGTSEASVATNTVSFHTAPTIGVRNTGSAGAGAFGGKIAEILIFNAVLSLADREKVEGYLAHKWGLASVLPGGHPYKASPP